MGRQEVGGSGLRLRLVVVEVDPGDLIVRKFDPGLLQRFHDAFQPLLDLGAGRVVELQNELIEGVIPLVRDQLRRERTGRLAGEQVVDAEEIRALVIAVDGDQRDLRLVAHLHERHAHLGVKVEIDDEIDARGDECVDVADHFLRVAGGFRVHDLHTGLRRRGLKTGVQLLREIAAHVVVVEADDISARFFRLRGFRRRVRLRLGGCRRLGRLLCRAAHGAHDQEHRKQHDQDLSVFHKSSSVSSARLRRNHFLSYKITFCQYAAAPL